MEDQNFDPNTVMRYVQSLAQKSGVSPDVLAQLGQLAEQSLKDKNVYPEFVNQMVSSGLASPDQFGKDIDYQAIISMIAMGRASQQMAGGM